MTTTSKEPLFAQRLMQQGLDEMNARVRRDTAAEALLAAARPAEIIRWAEGENPTLSVEQVCRYLRDLAATLRDPLRERRWAVRCEECCYYCEFPTEEQAERESERHADEECDPRVEEV